jgi:hypothetical protein
LDRKVSFLQDGPLGVDLAWRFSKYIATDRPDVFGKHHPRNLKKTVPGSYISNLFMSEIN